MAKKMIKKIKEYCGDCSAWSGTDCTRNPYAQGCLKEKIEEMAKDLYGHICGKVKCEDCKYHGDSEILSKYCDNYLRAKHLVEKGYRKVPDGGCVLDKGQNQNFAKFVMGEKAKTRKETAEKIADWLDNEKGYCGLGFLIKQKFCTEEKEND